MRSIVAERTFASAAVELSVPVATPPASASPAGWVSVLPVPVAASTTVAPTIGLPLASLAVTVIVALPLPAAIVGGAAATVDWDTDTAPAVTVTGAVWVTPMPSMAAETVLSPAAVELSAPVATPLASVGPTGWLSVLPVPVAASTTVAPTIGLRLASWAVTVIVALPLPAAIVGGAAATVESDADTEPAVTVTSAVWAIATPSIVAEMVFASAVVELNVPVATPLASVGPTGWLRVLPVPVAASTTVAPTIGLPLASLAVTVIVALPPPAPIVGGAAATVESDAETDPAVTVTGGAEEHTTE